MCGVLHDMYRCLDPWIFRFHDGIHNLRLVSAASHRLKAGSVVKGMLYKLSMLRDQPLLDGQNPCPARMCEMSVWGGGGGAQTASLVEDFLSLDAYCVE